MKARAQGELPDMGCALRLASLLAPDSARDGSVGLEVLDVGCATGHFLRTFKRQNFPIRRYVGLEIDPAMVSAGEEVWGREIDAGEVRFIQQDLERFSTEQRFDVVVCINAFMYFASAKTALTNLMRAARKRLIVRSYFTDSNYRIVRAQTTRNHDKSQIDEIDIFDDAGNMRCYDFWNIYSFTYIEALVHSIDADARVQWIDDKNVLSSLEQERKLNVPKRGATEVLGEYEISFPFILPWKYLSITFGTPEVPSRSP